MKEKIKKIAEKIWNIWAVVVVLLAIGMFFGSLEKFGWFGIIIFWTLIIIYILQITHKDREDIAREKEELKM